MGRYTIYYKDAAKSIKHRLDGPAVDWEDGSYAYYVEGKRHRLDGPAEVYLPEKIYKHYVNNEFKTQKEFEMLAQYTLKYYERTPDEYTIYYKDEAKTIRHRLDGPAIEWADGRKDYWVDDKRHRLDGPAVEYADGRKDYWVDGKRHRLDGPAIEYASGRKEYWVDNKDYSEDDWKKKVAEMTKENEFTVPEGYTSSKNATGDTIIFRKIDNKVVLDLKDHPSITRANGQKEYFVDNKRHRDFGPAVERSDGTVQWWDNDKLFYPLENEERKGDQYRFLNKIEITENCYRYYVCHKSSNLQAEFLMKEESSPKTFAAGVNEPSIRWTLDGKTVAEIWLKDGNIHRDGGPAKTSKDSEQWFHEGVPHRIGGPAITQKNYQAWYVGGMLHNLDGPAEIINGVPTKWALCGREISQEMFNLLVKHVTNLEKNKEILKDLGHTYNLSNVLDEVKKSPDLKQLWNLVVKNAETWSPAGKDRLIAAFSNSLGRSKEELALEIGGPMPDIPELENPVAEPGPEPQKNETSQISKLAKRMAAMKTTSLINKKLMPNTGIPAQSLVNFILGTAMQQSGQYHVMDLGREMKVESLKEVGLDLFDHLVKSLEKDLPKSLTAPTSVVKEEQPVQIVEEVPVSSKFRIG